MKGPKLTIRDIKKRCGGGGGAKEFSELFTVFTPLRHKTVNLSVALDD